MGPPKKKNYLNSFYKYPVWLANIKHEQSEIIYNMVAKKLRSFWGPLSLLGPGQTVPLAPFSAPLPTSKISLTLPYFSSFLHAKALDRNILVCEYDGGFWEVSVLIWVLTFIVANVQDLWTFNGNMDFWRLKNNNPKRLKPPTPPPPWRQLHLRIFQTL